MVLGPTYSHEPLAEGPRLRPCGKQISFPEAWKLWATSGNLMRLKGEDRGNEVTQE